MAVDNNEKPVGFGATIEFPAKPQSALRSPPSNESNKSSMTTGAIEKEIIVDSSNPYSAFYKHPDARRSMEESAPASKTHLDVAVVDRDLEAGAPLSAATTQNHMLAVDGKVKECTMWPSRQTMVERQKKYRRSRGCKLFKDMNSKQRLWAKIIIALLVIAAAVGLGLGISRAVGGGVWAGEGKSRHVTS